MPHVARLKDLVALAKPRLSLLVFATTAVGMWLAPGRLGGTRVTLILLASAAIVAAANTLNCFVERDSDALMRRTRDRPLPAGRLEPWVALVLGGSVALLSTAALLIAANPTTALLAAAAAIIYVGVYTPLKRVSWWAVVVGAVPGAIPPLMGWTAVTGSIDIAGLGLFALLFCWQLPHFLAISLYLKDDYARGGLRVLPVVHGDEAAKWFAAQSAVVLVMAGMLPALHGIAGPVYAVVALVFGGLFAAVAVFGLFREDTNRWARRVFLGSIVYLTVLLGVLVLES